MYDTVCFRLTQEEAKGVDFLEETACYLDDVGEHFYSGNPIITGNHNGLKVTANRYQLKVNGGSLCKYLLGDNFKTMGRGDAQRAIEKLSDELHLPMDKANVTRLDIALNFILKYPPSEYINHLGPLKYADRLQEPNGIYYNLNGGRLCFYDKNREQKTKRENIPEPYKDRNVLRYERRLIQRVARQLNEPEVTGASLYNEAFYIKVLNFWRDSYQAIKKINDVTINFQAMTTKKQLNKMGVLCLMERAGGQIEMINQINEAQKRGEISKKQAYDLRAAVNEASQLQAGLTIPNEAIQELDKKIVEAVRFYR